MKKFYIPNKSFRITTTGFLILLLTGFFAVSQAQVRTITGVVTASDTKETLPGASVLIKGTTSGAITDIDGKYSIKVDQQETGFGFFLYRVQHD